MPCNCDLCFVIVAHLVSHLTKWALAVNITIHIKGDLSICIDLNMSSDIVKDNMLLQGLCVEDVLLQGLCVEGCCSIDTPIASTCTYKM